MKKIFSILIIILLATSCATKTDNKTIENNEDKKIKIVTTIFPPYDFYKNIGKDKIEVKMLLKPGQEAHTYEPTPKDLKDIQDADIFVYTGGENDEWVENIIKNNNSNAKFIKLLDLVDVKEEEVVEGMEIEHDHEEDNHDENEHENEEHEHNEHEIDEHVWTSITNSIKIVEHLSNTLIELDADNKELYETNKNQYIEELEKLNKDFLEMVATKKIDTIIVADRFPFRYLIDDINLKYYAAFSGCSEETEADPKTIAFLIEKTKELNINTVFYIEFSDQKIANTIKEETGVNTLQLHSLHNITKEELDNNETYISLMYKNLENLAKAIK